MKSLKVFSKEIISKLIVVIMIISIIPVIPASAEEYTYDSNGFAIVNGVLKDYKGPGGDIVIPAGVTTIATGSLANVECTSISLPKGLKTIESNSVNMAFGAKIYLPSDWEGGCETPKYGMNTTDFSIHGCSIVVPADIKVIDTNFIEANKIIVTGAKDDSYKNAAWYGSVKHGELDIALPVVKEEDFDKDGFVIKDGVLLTYDGPGGDIVIPDSVKEIGPIAFAGLDIIDSVTIPDSVTKVGEACFCRLMHQLKELSTGNGITELPKNFMRSSMGCENLILGENIEIIGESALYACYAYEINLPESVKKIDENGLYFIDNIKSLDLSHVEMFGYDLFYFTAGKKTVDVIDLSSAKTIGNMSLQKITTNKLIIGANLVELGWDALPEVTDEIVWPENGKLRTLPEGAIRNISVLENSPIPDYIEKIEDSAAYGTANAINLPKNLKTLGKNALPIKTEGKIVLPSGWTGTSEVNKDAFMVSYGTKQSDFSLVIPTDVKGVEDNLINATGISTFVIQKLPGETSYKNKDWYKKLVASGKEIVEENATDTRLSFSRIADSNEYEVNVKSTRVSEDAGSMNVVFDIPEGFSFVDGSYTGATGKLTSVVGNKVTISLPTNKLNDVSVKLSQNELNTIKKKTNISGAVEGSEVVSGTVELLYANMALSSCINHISVAATGTPGEKVELYVDSVKYEGAFDNTGRFSKFVEVSNSKCEVYLKADGLETKHEIVDVELKDSSEITVKQIIVENEDTKDITRPGQVVRSNWSLMTYYLDLEGISGKTDGLTVCCGKYTFPVKYIDGQYLAQGHTYNDIPAKVQVKFYDDVIFETSVKWIVDPSGYIYEISPEHRVEGATATIYYSEYESGKNAVKWDAENYGQKNDLITDKNGCYAWDVPEGYYRVVVDKKGYTTAKSNWLPVPPVQLDVNLAIKDMRAARVSCVAMEADHMNIYFDKYMNESQAVLPENYTISDGVNKITISKATAFDKAADNTRTYVKAVRLDFEKPLTGDQLRKLYKLSFASGKFSTYYGTSSVLSAITGIKVDKEVTEIKTDKGTAVRLGNNIEVTATLLPVEAAAGKSVRATVADGSIAKILSVSKVDANGNVKIVLEGEKYGQTDVKITLENGVATATIPVFVAIDSEVKKSIQQAVGIAKLPIEKDKSGNRALEDGEQPEAPKDDKVEDKTDGKQDVTTESSNNSSNTTTAPKVGSTVKVGKAKYVIGKKYTATYKCPTTKTATSATIPASIKIKGKTYKVTAIAANAFKNNKKLKKVTIGKNVKTIGKSAFYGCKNLKTVTIKTTKLSIKTVGKNAFAKINAKAKVKVPKSKLKSYKKILKNKGLKGKKQKVTK